MWSLVSARAVISVNISCALSWSIGDNMEKKTCEFLGFYQVTANFGSSTMFRTSISGNRPFFNLLNRMGCF